MPIEDKIRVLLIDDQPQGLLSKAMLDGSDHYMVSLRTAENPKAGGKDLKELFDVRWLATPEEAREFRDLSRLVSLSRPLALGEEGWVPEIVCFDYAITGDRKSVAMRLPEELVREVSPLPQLRDLAGGLAVIDPPVNPLPDTGQARDKDNMGCFAGCLISTLFWDHPCSAVAHTRKGDDKTLKTEAAFFEWFMEVDTYKTFETKGKPELSWGWLLERGVASLRRRIEELVRGRIVHLGFSDLLKMLDGELPASLEIRSRYGKRHLPTEALFLDVDAETTQEAARAWAIGILDSLFSDFNAPEKPSDDLGAESTNPSLAEFQQGMSLADHLWAGYHSDLVEKRFRLSELCGRLDQLDASERRELDELLALFGLEEADLRRARGALRRNIHDLRQGSDSGRAQRWAALMVMVRLEAQLATARRAYKKLGEHAGIPPVFDPAFSGLTQEDVYLGLFPVAQAPLRLPFETGKSPSEAWAHVLRELPSADDPKGGLKIELKDVLKGRRWKKEPSEKRCVPCGLIAGERYLLAMYARALGFEEGKGLEEVEWLRDSASEEAEAAGGES